MKILYIDNFRTEGSNYVYDVRLTSEGNVLLSGSNVLPVVAGEDRDVTLRKTCDQDIEILVDGVRIGVGSLNFGKGMTPQEAEERALTPEADEETIAEKREEAGDNS